MPEGGKMDYVATTKKKGLHQIVKTLDEVWKQNLTGLESNNK